MTPKETIAARFWAKVTVGAASDCWLWNGARLPRGYGQFRLDGRCVVATHVAVFLATGEWPEPGMYVLHKCDNPRCVNAAHLFVGTQKQNIADMIAKGRRVLADPATVRYRTGEANHRSRLTDATARRAVALLSCGMSQTRAAKELGVSRGAIQAIASGKTWKHIERSASNG